MFRLGIVGHGKEKFTAETEKKAKQNIHYLFDEFEPGLVISGGSPMGGVDIWAEELAKERGIETLIFKPKIHRWDAAGGYKERNLKIANNSDVVAVIVVRDYPPGYQGMVFSECYHCKDDVGVPKHKKSGGCWTARKCQDSLWIVI